MKWMLKKLIIALIEALIVKGLADALGLDLEGILKDLIGDVEEGSGAEESSSEEDSSLA